MSAFKPGDRVKALRPIGGDVETGRSGTLIDTDDSALPYLVHFDGRRTTWCGADAIELIGASLPSRFDLAREAWAALLSSADLVGVGYDEIAHHAFAAADAFLAVAQGEAAQ